VGYIFQVVVGFSKAADYLKPKLGAEEKGSRILIDASKIIADFIKREGRVEVDKVKKVCNSFEGVELVDYREKGESASSYNARIQTSISARWFFLFL
jgi:hypothetical protein